MPKSRPPYSAEFRQQIIELAQAGGSPADPSREFGPTSQSIIKWLASRSRLMSFRCYRPQRLVLHPLSGQQHDMRSLGQPRAGEPGANRFLNSARSKSANTILGRNSHLHTPRDFVVPHRGAKRDISSHKSAALH